MAKKNPNKKQPKTKTNTKKVENQINDLKTELKEEQDKYLRLFAEFENYKKIKLDYELDVYDFKFL